MNNKQSKFDYKIIVFGTIFLIFLAFFIMLVPLNSFKHGFYFNKVERIGVPSEDWYEEISLESPYSFDFKATSNSSGIAIYFASNDANSGTVDVTIGDNKYEIDVNSIKPNDWYILSTNDKFIKDVTYTVTIEAICDKAPTLQGISNDYIDNNLINCNVLVALGYSHNTFSSFEKSLITLFLIAVLIFLAGEFFLNGSKTRTISAFLAITVVFNWVFMFNSIDDENTDFINFQYDSEKLVLDGFDAQDEGLTLSPYGLGTYNQFYSFVANEDWNDGYNRTSPTILINKNNGTSNLAQIGNVVRFSKGQQYRIIDVIDYGDRYGLTLDSSETLTPAKNGSLADAIFLSEKGEILPRGEYEGYVSSLGLQGKIFRVISSSWDKSVRELNLRMVAAFFTSIVLSGIVLLINKKYNFLMALCFGVTFLLSPWIVNYSNSLYWVEATWFLPMLVGLICSIWIDKRWARISCYVLAFATIMLKSLCGYEFITAVMLGLISFILVDLMSAIINKDKNRALLVFRTAFIIGIMALMGFFMAIVLHANIRGDGSIIEGIKSIIERDVLRRVGGGGLNDFEEIYWPSMNASIYETFSLYFHFKTDVIAGLDPNTFIGLVILPIVIFLYDYSRKKLNVEEVLLYVVFFLTSISWFVLAKNHSYVHTHMNFVMWYFGFVQICLYVILKKVMSFTSRKEENT